jgi:hypothetical protein
LKSRSGLDPCGGLQIILQYREIRTAMTRTSMMACLVLFAASGAMAQTSAAGGVNLDPGSSGGTAGLISGGGTISTNLDSRDSRPVPAARADEQRKQAKVDSDAKEERSKARAKAARARAEATDRVSEKSKRVMKENQQLQRFYGYPYVYPYSFSTFGSRSYMRSRD